MRCASAITLLAVLPAVPVFVMAQSPSQDLTITNYQFVSEQRLTRTESYITYRADVVNAGSREWTALTATPVSLAPSVEIVPGQANLHFGMVPAHGRVTSTNTFTILVDRSVEFSFSNLTWSFLAPVANAGPNQTVAVGETVVLNGSGSSNPSGVGTLTYEWTFVSRPAGTATILQNSTSVSSSFQADVPGAYVVRLTVSNGTGEDSADVVISTLNSPPVANAGPNQTVAAGTTVVLNGSGSSDVDGDLLTYLWTIISAPPFSLAQLSNSTAVSPTFIADKPGTYIVQLVVSDGKSVSTPSTVTITTKNTPPVASAGTSQAVFVGDEVHLSGAGSTDVDGDPLTYRWSFLSRPEGSLATLSSTSSVNPMFIADRAGTYIVQLIVNDGKTDSQPATVTITTDDIEPPVANAGDGQTVLHGVEVTLHGSGTDPQDLPLTYSWSLITRPSGSTATLQGATTATPSFIADWPGTYVAQLIVNNGYLNSVPATVSITTTNTPPVAHPGSNLVVAAGATVNLDGGASSDSDHDPLTYSWSLLSRPDGSNAALTGAKTATPSFPADIPGIFVVQLIVNDGFTNSTPATMTVTAEARTITLTPDPLNLELAPGKMTVTIGTPAPAGGLDITVVNSDAAVAEAPASVHIGEGSKTAVITVTPLKPGSTIIMATLTGYRPGFGTVNVSQPSLALSLASGNVGLTRTLSGTVTLSSPAPSGGITVTLSSDPGGVVSFDSPSLTVPAGELSAGFLVTGVAEGGATITAAAPLYGAATAHVDVRSLGAILLASGVTVGPGRTANLGVTLASPAPIGGATIELTSSDTSKLIVTRTIEIAQGQTAPATPAQVTGVSFGSAVVTASSPGFAGDSKTVEVKATLSFSPQTFTLGVGGSRNVVLSLSSTAPSGGLAVSLASDHPNVASIPPSVMIAEGSDNVSFPVGGLAEGTVVITATPAEANCAGASATVTVTTFGSISLPSGISLAVGSKAPFPVTLTAPAPEQGVTITLTSTNEAILTVAPATLVIPAGQTTPLEQPEITATGLGNVSIIATAPGFGTSRQSVQTTATLGISPQDVTLSGPQVRTFEVSLSAPAPAGGLQVNLSAAPAGILTLPASVQIAEGATTATFTPAVAGTGQTTITAAAALAGVSPATTKVTVDAAGAIILPGDVEVAPGQSVPFAVTLPSAAPEGGVTVTLATSDASILTIAPASVLVPAGATTPAEQPQVTGVKFGSASITASAPAYIPSSRTVRVTANAGFTPPTLTITGQASQNLTLAISAPAPSGGMAFTLTAAPADVITMPSSVTIAPNETTAIVTVRGAKIGNTIITAKTASPDGPSATANVTVETGGTIGLPASASVALGQTADFAVTLPAPAPSGGITVTLSSSDASKVSLSEATITIPPGQTTPATQPRVTGKAPGSATITASAAAYTSSSSTVAVTATATFSPLSLSISGTETQNLTLTLSGPAPEGGLTFALSSSNTAAATVPDSVTIAQNATSVAVQVTGVAPGAAVIRASTPNLADATANVTVVEPSDFVLPASPVVVAPGYSAAFPISLAKPATKPVLISLTSSDTSKVTLNVETLYIAEGQTSPVMAPKVNGIAPGSAVITASAFGFKPASQTVIVSLTLRFQPSTVQITGAGTQTTSVVLSAPAPEGGLTVALSSSHPEVATVPASVFLGANMSSIGVTVTGKSPGATVITATAPDATPGTANVTVVAPGTINLPSNATVALGQSAPFAVSLSNAAPAGGVTLALSSSDTTKSTISPATVNIPQGATVPASQPQLQGINVGSLDITVSAPGYAPVSAPVQVTAAIAWDQQSVTIPFNTTQNLLLRLSSAAPQGGLTVSLLSSNPAVASVDASATFSAGSTAVEIPVHALTVGTTTVKASGLNIPEVSMAVTVSGPLAITTSALLNGKVGEAYSFTLEANGGTPGYTWELIAGSLPEGLTFDGSTGTLAGTPAATAANVSLTFRATDHSTPPQMASKAFTLTIAPATLSIVTASLPDGRVGVAYSQTLAATGGTAGYTWELISGTLPAGLSFNTSTGQIGSAPAEAVCNAALGFRVTDSGTPPQTATKVLTLNVAPATLALTTASLLDGRVGVAYSQTLTVSGGSGPYTFALISGLLPAGLSLNTSTGEISGTPAAAATNVALTFRVTDAATACTPAQTATKELTLTIGGPALSITTTSLPNGQVGVAYSQTLAATGGTPPYIWELASGALPDGLSLNAATGSISGTPAATANATPLTFRVTDSSAPAQTDTKTLTLTIAEAALQITTAALPDGKVGEAYSQTVATTGGKLPFTWALSAGILPAGLSLNSSTGQISGTPTTPSTSTPFTLRVTDSSTPAQTATRSFTLTVAPADLVITTATPLPNGRVGVAYSQTLAATGGIQPYTWALASGTLPDGLSLNTSSGLISGTPTTAVTNAALTFRVTDSALTPQSVTKTFALTIAPPVLTITTVSLPDGQVGVAYAGGVAATGGVPTYTWSVISGTLPDGLTLNTSTGQITGTPTTAAVNVALTFRVVDSDNPPQSATRNLTLTIAPPGLAITTNSLANGQVGAAYSQPVQAAGGTPPYTWTITAGTLPGGLSLNAGTGLISGTPAEIVANRSLTFRVTDSGSPAQNATKTLTLTIAPAPVTITTAALPDGQVGTAYSLALAATGGIAPLTWSLTAGTLPTGMTFNAAGVLGGTPTEYVANRSLTFQASDSSTPPLTATKTLSLTIAPAPLAITTAALPDGQKNTAYSFNLSATGGVAPLTWSIIAGTLPAGMTFSTAGALGGTPTEYVTARQLTFQVRDSSTPAVVVNKILALTITPEPLSITTTALPNGTVGAPYSYALAATGGITPLTWTITAGTLPAGMSLTPAGILGGTPTEAVTNRSITFQAADSSTPALTATKTLTLTIAAPPLVITTTALPDGQVGMPYSFTLVATGGLAPLNWSLTGGTLPAGLTLSAAGQISGIPLAAGTASLTFRVADASTPAQSATKTLNLTIAPAAADAIAITGTTVGKDLQSTVTITLPTAAPTNLNVTITSSDAALVRLAARPGDSGTNPLIVPVSQGSNQFFLYVHGMAGSGSATLTASAPSYSNGVSVVNLTPSAFVLDGPNGIGSSFLANLNQTTTVTVRSYRLDASLNPVQAQPLRGGLTMPVTLNSSLPSVGTITPSVSFSDGASSASATFTALAPGTTTLTAVPPAGFSTPAGSANTLTATVQSLGMTIALASNRVGHHLQTSAQIRLTGAPSADLPVTIVSDNPTSLKLSSSSSVQGSGSLMLNIGAGFSYSPAFVVQGFATSGSVTITASAPGYPSASATVTLTPSGLVLSGPNGLGGNFTTTTGIGNTNIEVYTARLDAPNSYAEPQALAGGLSIPVNVTTSRPAVGTIVNPSLTINGGSGSALTEFQPVSEGTTVLSVSGPADLTIPAQYASLSATVSTSRLALSDGVVVGKNLQVVSSVLLGGLAPAGGVTVTLTSTNPSLLMLSASSTDPGAAAIQVTIPEGQGSAWFYVRGMADSGSASVNASADGYAPDSTTVELGPSGVVVQGNNNDFHYVMLTMGPQPVTVMTALLDPSTHAAVEEQTLQPGLTLTASLSVDDATVGTIVSPVTITGGSSSALADFTPLRRAQTYVRLATPPGYTQSSDHTSVFVWVF
jgi:putative flippase GtrA